MSARVAILCDFQQMGYDQTNPALFQPIDYIHVHKYPNATSQDANNIVGREGDKFLVKYPFRVQTTAVNGVQPKIKSIVVAVVAIKAGKTDFIVEQNTVDVSQACMQNGQQVPTYSATRGYQTFANDPFNQVALKSIPKRNAGTMAAYLFTYGLTLRYDYWNNILPSMPGFNPCNNDINNDLGVVNNSWNSLQQNGWSLVLRITVNIAGYDNFVTNNQAQTSILVFPMGAPPLTGPSYVVTSTYYDAISGVQVPNIQVGGQTRISITFTPDGTAIPAQYDSYKAMIWVDLIKTGGVSSRRIASTEIAAESSTPFSPAPKNGSPSIYYANAISMNIYSSGIVIVEAIYDDTILNWGVKGGLGSAGMLELKDTSIQTAGGIDIETAGGKRILR